MTDGEPCLLRFNNCYWNVRPGIEYKVSALGATLGFRILYSYCQLAAHKNTAFSKTHFFAKLLMTPTSLLNSGGNELGADVSFAQLILIHHVPHRPECV